MSRIPILGSQQTDVRMDGTPPRVRTRSLLCFRAWDGTLAPLNEGISVAYLGRTVATNIFASDGTEAPLVASAPAFSSIDWDADGVREDDALLMSEEEALRYFDATTEQLEWDTGPKVFRVDGIEIGNALVDGAPYFSLTNDDASGAWLAVLGSGDGRIGLHHHNGIAETVSQLAIAPGARFSLRALLHADGSVEVGLLQNAGAEVGGTRSGAIAPAAEWGGGAGVQARLNEWGAEIRGTQSLRYFAAFNGTATRTQLLEVL